MMDLVVIGGVDGEHSRMVDKDKINSKRKRKKKEKNVQFNQDINENFLQESCAEA